MLWTPARLRLLEKEMATHSIVLAWRIPETGEPGGLPSIGSQRVGHDWGSLATAAADYVTIYGNEIYDCHEYFLIFLCICLCVCIFMYVYVYIYMYIAFLVTQTVKNLPAMHKTQVWSLGREDPLEGNGNPLQYSCLENSITETTGRGVAKSWTWLSNWHLFYVSGKS